MRILLVLCAVLAIAVTSLARPKEIENANDKTAAEVLVANQTKNESSNATSSSGEKSSQKSADTSAAQITTKETSTHKPTPGTDPVQASEATTTKCKDDSPSVPITEKVITTSVPTTTVAPTKATTVTPTNATTVVPPNSTTTIITTVPTTTDNPKTTTIVPPAPICPSSSERHFDGLSFLGGIILSICLIGIGVFLCKYCQKINEDKYRTL